MSREPALSRRGAIVAAAGVGATALSGCSTKAMPSNVPLTRRSPGAPEDVLHLQRLLAAEHYAIAAYAAAVPLLRGAHADAAKQFLAQELAHASELQGMIVQAGAQPAKPPASYALGNPRGSRELLELLHAVERAQLLAYLEVVGRLTPSRLRAAIAAILANEAQHAAVLRSALALPPVPSPLVSGME